MKSYAEPIKTNYATTPIITKKLKATPLYFKNMSIIAILVHLIKGDLLISTKSLLSFDGHQ